MSDLSKKDVGRLTDEELAQHEADLAEQKLAIKNRQNEVRAEREFRAVMATVSPETRRIVGIRLGGETSPSGTAASAAEEA